MTPLDCDKVLLVHPLGYKAVSAGKDTSRLADIMVAIRWALHQLQHI